LTTCEACAYNHSGPQIATWTCSAGACAVGTCSPGFADCDGNPANGCEAQTGTATTCGSGCQPCPAGQLCENGTCIAGASCTFPKTVCSDGSCRDLTSDPTSCGACGNVCGAAPGWTATCVNSGCTVVDGGASPPCACAPGGSNPEQCICYPGTCSLGFTA